MRVGGGGAGLGRLAPVVLVVGLWACGGAQGGGELHARKAVLAREVAGMRDMVARMERGEAALPEGDVVIALEESLLRDLLVAQLPFEADVDRFHVRLDAARVAFRGSPLVTLEGSIVVIEHPNLAGDVRLLGTLENIVVDQSSGTLRTTVAVDHIDLKKVAGMESFLSGGTMDELARRLRKELAGRLPEVTIPVKVEPRIELPALTSGPVRIAAAAMPLEVGVSQVFAVGGRLWVAIHVAPGDFVKVAATATPSPVPPSHGGAPSPGARP
jgi:hypothetical protein